VARVLVVSTVPRMLVVYGVLVVNMLDAFLVFVSRVLHTSYVYPDGV